MRIESLRIQLYRSLYDITLSPRPFRLVVGANNAGKTNLLDAIHFLGEVHRYGIDVAVGRKGGFENVAYRHQRRTKNPIAFTIVVSLTASELERERPLRSTRLRKRRYDMADRLYVEHHFELKADSRAIAADFSVSLETIRLFTGSPSEPSPLASVVRRGENLDFRLDSTVTGLGSKAPSVYPLNDGSFQAFARESLRPLSLAIDSMGFNDALRLFATNLSQTRLYQFSPLECRKPGVPSRYPELERHGGNLPAVVAYMQTRHLDEWQNIMSQMKEVAPTLSDVRTVYTSDRRIALQFVETGYGRPWSSEDISDGTVQSLALFCALFDPRTPFVLVEEPENAIHPWIVRVFARACQSVSDKQVLVTTHSPVLMAHVSPEEIDVAWRAAGRTSVQPMSSLDTMAVKEWTEGTVDAFDLIDMGAIQQAVPG